jgi:hydroxymethylpyrimidine pyrophosphatase-like HAD family hydrolase
VALDVDGTVLGFDGELSERVRAAVAAVRDAGVHVVVATGRALYDTLPVLDRLGLVAGWAVCSNGAVTVHLDPSLPRGYEVAHVVTFDAAPALRLLREQLPAALYAVEDAEGRYRLTAPFPPGELDGYDPAIVSFDELLRTPAARVIVRSPEHTPEHFLELTERVGLHGVNYAVGWTAWLDLAPEGVSKASALAAVAALVGVGAEDALAVGDGRNDIDMLQWAGHSVAMGNAVPEVQAAADEVTAHVHDDGAALVLESILPHP